MIKYIKYKFDLYLEKSFLSLIFFLFFLSFLGIIAFSIVFYILFLTGIISIEGVFGKFIWQTFTYFIDVGTISGESYGENTAADTFYKIIITLFGIVVFSTLIGIISQALSNRIEDLREGKGAIKEKNHIIIFNYSKKTIPLLVELFKAYESEKKTIVLLSTFKPKELLEKIENAIFIPKNINLICRKGYAWQKKMPQYLDFKGAANFIFLKPDINDEFQSENDCDDEVGKSLTTLVCSKEFQKSGGKIVAEFSSKIKQELYEKFVLERISNSIDHTKDTTSFPLFIESEDVRAKVISQAVINPDIIEIYDEIFSFEGSEIYFIDVKDLEIQTNGQLSNINNLDLYQLNRIFNQIICIGTYNQTSEISNSNQSTLSIDLNIDHKIDFSKKTGLIFISKNENEIFKEIKNSNINIKDIKDIKDIKIELDEFNHDINIALFSNKLSNLRLEKIISNINYQNKGNIKKIRIYDDKDINIQSKFLENLKTKLNTDSLALESSGKEINEQESFPFKNLSLELNEFNCYIFVYDDNIDSDDNINNVKDNKVFNNFALFSNLDVSNKEFYKDTRALITEVGAYKTKDILERFKKDIFLPYFGSDIIDVNTLISKIISSGIVDKKNKLLIDLFLSSKYRFKTYTLNQTKLDASFCEIEKFFSYKKEILIGLIDYEFKDVKNIYNSNFKLERRKINEILINPEQTKKIHLNKGDRFITLSNF